jgi:hypothetical protein
LKECRLAWVEKYGPVDWDDGEEWFDLGSGLKPLAEVKPAAAKTEPAEPKSVAEPFDEVTDDEVRQYFKYCGAPDYIRWTEPGWRAKLTRPLKVSIMEWRRSKPAEVIPLVKKPLRRI